MSASQLRKVTFFACLFLVMLRVAIGWQFLYEGMYKYKSQFTGQPWSAAGYLKNAQGPFRDHYRSLVHDPDDLEKLDYDKVAAMWDDWEQRFVAKHPDLSDGDKKKLHEFLNGPEPQQWMRNLAELPPGVDVTAVYGFVTYDPEKKRLVTTRRLLPREVNKLLQLVEVKQDPTEEEKPANELAKAYQKSVKELGLVCSRLSLKEQLQVSLLWDKDRAGVTITAEDHKALYPVVEGTLDEHRPGDIELYRNALARYESKLNNVTENGAPEFAQEHLGKQWSEIQQKRGELVGPVNAWTAELVRYGEDLLDAKQLARGGVPVQVTQTDVTNQRTIWALLILGSLLMLGFFSRFSAFFAALLLLSFYFAMPPLPGVPAAPGPEHSLIVNKNLIEVIACLALASLPTGRWFGIDGFFRRVILRKKD